MTFRRRAASLTPFLSSLNSCTASSSSSSFWRNFISPRLSFSGAASSATEQAAGAGLSAGRRTKRSLCRQLFQIGLISLTGGFFLSAVNDLAIFHGCSSKAIEKASQNQQIVELLGLPIVRGPWYDASLAVGRRRHSVSSTFPVSGLQGTGIFQLKAIRRGGETTFSFLRHNDWDILILDALLHVPSDDEKHQTVRISVAGNCLLPDASSDCVQCQLPRAASVTSGE